MKKLLYLITLVTLPLSSIAQTQLNINADIRGKSCKGGLGLCSVIITPELQKQVVISKTTSYKHNETTLVLEYNKTLLSEQEQSSLVGKAFSKVTTNEKIDFIQEDDLLIDNQTLILLGFDVNYITIKKGNYFMVINKDTVQVILTLSQI